MTGQSSGHGELARGELTADAGTAARLEGAVAALEAIAHDGSTSTDYGGRPVAGAHTRVGPGSVLLNRVVQS
jgi:hypothetical protein